VADAEHVVHHFKPLVLGGIVNCSDVRYLCILGSGMVLQEGEDGSDTGGWDVDGKLVLPHREPGSSSVHAPDLMIATHTAGRIWAGRT